MTVESNYVIAIDTLSDWLKRLAPVFQPTRSKPEPIAPRMRDFSRAMSELQVIARNCDWFILFAPVVIGWRNCFGFGLSTLKTTLTEARAKQFSSTAKTNRIIAETQLGQNAVERLDSDDVALQVYFYHYKALLFLVDTFKIRKARMSFKIFGYSGRIIIL